MVRVSAADLERVLTLVRGWHEAHSPDELVALAATGLRRLVPCDAVGWNAIDLASGQIRFVTDPPDYATEGLLGALRRLIDQHPLVQHYATTRDGSPAAISDFLASRDFHRLELYADVYRPLRVEDQITFAVEVDGLLAGFAFSRDRRSFSERDRSVLDLVRPHLVFAHDDLRARTAAQERLGALERGLEEQGRGAVVVRGERAEALSRESLRLLADWFAGEAPPVPDPGRPLVLERGARRLTARRGQGDPAVVLLDETRLAPDPERARALGLSRRETEVLALAARGLSDAQVAERLVVSLRTVQKHLENAYRRLGVSGRREALARLLGG